MGSGALWREDGLGLNGIDIGRAKGGSKEGAFNDVAGGAGGRV
jgi:hypothetical protein